MKLTYHGRKVVKDEFGNVKCVYDPCAEITYTDAEEELACSRAVAACGEDWNYDGFNNQIVVYVSDKEDFNDFMKVWKATKKAIGR